MNNDTPAPIIRTHMILPEEWLRQDKEDRQRIREVPSYLLTGKDSDLYREAFAAAETELFPEPPKNQKTRPPLPQPDPASKMLAPLSPSPLRPLRSPVD